VKKEEKVEILDKREKKAEVQVKKRECGGLG